VESTESDQSIVSVTLTDGLDHLHVNQSVVTIGTFDGVHLGHQLLLKSAVARGQELGLPVVVVTFEPVPVSVLRPEVFPGRICSADEKRALIVTHQPDHLVTLTFDLQLAQWSPAQFMQALVTATGMTELWIGEAFALGKGRAGGVEQLTEIGRTLEYSVCALKRREDLDGVISSSRIRHAIELGDVSLANRLLGRPFTVTGEVIRGAQYGRTIGFPTANVVPPVDQVALADGIYASRAKLPGEDEYRKSMTYVGTRPTVNTGARQIETHILDYDGDLYGRIIRVQLMQRLRPDEHFPSVAEMIAQLQQDEVATRQFFAELTEAIN
jgi:riboflavin kinase / FMN adenylyltransferase